MRVAPFRSHWVRVGNAYLNIHDATTHTKGQSTVTVDSDRAADKTYSRAYHLSMAEGADAREARRPLLGPESNARPHLVLAERKLTVEWIDMAPTTALFMPPMYPIAANSDWLEIILQRIVG